MKIDRVYGMIEIEVWKLDRPCTIWMYNGIRKFAAVPTNSIAAIANVVAFSGPDFSTSRSKICGRCAAFRRRNHTKNPCPPIAPSRIRIGAGDTPSIANGAAGVARSTPQEFSPLNPKLSRMIDPAARNAPTQSITTPGWGGTTFNRKLNSRFTAASTTIRAKEYRHRIVDANVPAISSASTPAAGIAAARNPIDRACCSPE
nr:hypothetical protein [Cryobacterium breve]